MSEDEIIADWLANSANELRVTTLSLGEKTYQYVKSSCKVINAPHMDFYKIGNNWYKISKYDSQSSSVQSAIAGKVLNIKNCFTTIGITNCPREISRMVEKPFGVKVSRTPRVGKSRFGQSITWTDYRLNLTEYNKPGIEKMKEYVNYETQVAAIAVTGKEDRTYKQLGIFPED